MVAMILLMRPFDELATDHEFLVLLAERISRRRQEMRLEQVELALRAKCSPAYISRIERAAIINPKVLDLRAIAAGLELPLGALLTPLTPRDPDADITRALVDRFGPRIGGVLVRLDHILALMEQDDAAALSTLVANTVQKYEVSIN